MKKIYLFALTALLLSLTACLGNDEPNEQTVNILMYNRVTDTQAESGAIPYFSQSTCGFKLIDRNSALGVRANIALRVADGNVVSFDTGDLTMQRTSSGAYVYAFTCPQLTSGGHTITNLVGSLDIYGALYVSFEVDGRYVAHCTSEPYYKKTSTEVRNAETDEMIYTTSDAQYGIAINVNTMKAVVYLMGFKPGENDATLSRLHFIDLDATVTAAGYRITGTDATAQNTQEGLTNVVDEYKAKSVELDVYDNGRRIGGEIVLDNGKKLILSGYFYNSELSN